MSQSIAAPFGDLNDASHKAMFGSGTWVAFEGEKVVGAAKTRAALVGMIDGYIATKERSEFPTALTLFRVDEPSSLQQRFYVVNNTNRILAGMQACTFSSS
jgi:hypothetical protein